nr:MAG TPA: hypothetical protein [Caudoviricetes sp.]
MDKIICLSPLAFYDNINKQNHRKSYAYNHISPLIMNLGVIDSFQICIGKYDSNISIENVYLVNYKDGSQINIKSKLEENGLRLYNNNNYALIEYPGFLNVIVTEEGYYYLKISLSNKNTYFSEIFCFTNYIGNSYLEIKYNNPNSRFYLKNGLIDLRQISFIIRLQTELGKPEYSFEEESTKRLGYLFIESQVSKKVYKFNVILPEYLCDALRIVRLCSNIKISTQDSEYEPIAFEMNVDWQEQGDLASVNCQFDIDNIIYNSGDTSIMKGDFNNDFNIDFKKD